MLPVFTASEMRALDARAVADLGIPGPTLMENAGAGAAALVARRFAPIRGRRVVVVCGKGNNGGDGFVVARHLRSRGASVRVFLVGRREEVQGDAARALRRWRGGLAEVTTAAGIDALQAALAGAALAVDALLGTGLTGPARGQVARAIEALNAAGAPVLALDLPSGLDSDRGSPIGPAVRAVATATFAGHKRALVQEPAAALAGDVTVVPIGIPDLEVRRGIQTFLLEASDIRAHFPPRAADSHKGSFGHLLIVAGSLGKTGAAALAARGALRGGAGLVTVATAASQQPIVAALGMEHMTEPLAETAAQSISAKARERILELAAGRDAVALGPGLSQDPETQELVRRLVVEVTRPMVIDADALSALAGHLELLRRAPAPRLLTPHPGEMARMLGIPVAAIQDDRVETVRRLCRERAVWCVLKGARSVIGEPGGRVSVNPTGNPGMASGGTGDVLTGLAGACLARGLAPAAALESAVFLHGLAGDLAAGDRGQDGLIAGDLVEALPRAIRSLGAGGEAGSRERR
jgi:NAD(P)H-hydrate epimerase